ncbi:hypothetical protein LXL04_034907 [Taraxacum kok-saghyz]
MQTDTTIMSVCLEPQLRYYRMFEPTQDGLGKNASVHSIHGSLLAAGELLSLSTTNYYYYYYYFFFDNRGSHPTRPLDDPTDPTSGQHEHLVNSCARQPTLWVYPWPSLIETGESRTHDQSYGMVGTLPLGHQEMVYLPQIIFMKNSLLVKLQIAPRRGRPSLEALACVGNIANAMGPAMESHVCSLLDAMFSAGLSSLLVESLEQITIRERQRLQKAYQLLGMEYIVVLLVLGIAMGSIEYGTSHRLGKVGDGIWISSKLEVSPGSEFGVAYEKNRHGGESIHKNRLSSHDRDLQTSGAGWGSY